MTMRARTSFAVRAVVLEARIGRRSPLASDERGPSCGERIHRLHYALAPVSLDALAPDQRAVVQLVLQQERSYEDLAGLLGITADAVRERAHRGLDRLAPTEGVSDDERAAVADYLLGQQSVSAPRGHAQPAHDIELRPGVGAGRPRRARRGRPYAAARGADRRRRPHRRAGRGAGRHRRSLHPGLAGRGPPGDRRPVGRGGAADPRAPAPAPHGPRLRLRRARRGRRAVGRRRRRPHEPPRRRAADRRPGHLRGRPDRVAGHARRRQSRDGGRHLQHARGHGNARGVRNPELRGRRPGWCWSRRAAAPPRGA